MKDRLWMPARQIKGWVRSQGDRALNAFAYKGLLPRRWAARRIAAFWEQQAPAIHATWGRGNWDFEILGRVIDRYHPASVLDIGCGSGRLFPLYLKLGVKRVLGVDISAAALALARRDYPAIRTRQCRIQDLRLDGERFGLIISNRVLQHIPPAEIAPVIGRLGEAAALFYLNELANSDDLAEEFFMFRHEYNALFAVCGFKPLEEGGLGKQTYWLYGRA